jgi:hypothetical protein
VPHYHPTLAEIWTYPAAELAAHILDATVENKKPEERYFLRSW